MIEHLVEPLEGGGIPITGLTTDSLGGWLAGQEEATKRWVSANGFAAEKGTVCLLADPDGRVGRVLFGYDPADPWSVAILPARLPDGTYRIDPEPVKAKDADWAALGWHLACHQFTRYKAGRDWPRLEWPAAADRTGVARTAAATRLVRDLVNTPASDLGPGELAQAAQALAARHDALFRTIVGDALLEQGYPAIHAVGRASARPPRLIDLRWGDEAHRRLTLVGKGVCFDSGGLDIKPAAGMKLMKKDMGGAAHVLGLAQMIMEAKLPVRLRVLIPAVENVISGNAFRPLDILATRKGLTVEVGNTDAEGRLVLADALAEADAEHPDLLIDLATLTGAARTALGPELPAMFTDDEALAAGLQAAALEERDPFWRLPLWRPYRRLLDSQTADIANASDSPFAGAITAALFLREFVAETTPWIHLDILAWNPSGRPGRPEGGEAMCLRALFHLIRQRYQG